MVDLKLVKNSPKYWEFIRTLRNHEDIAPGFIKQSEITDIQQATYMLQYNNNYWICLVDDEPAGYVGVIDDDIRVATHPDYQGKGVGTFMIDKIMIIHPTSYAKVKLDNDASLRLFEKCGFKKKYYLLEKE